VPGANPEDLALISWLAVTERRSWRLPRDWWQRLFRLARHQLAGVPAGRPDRASIELALTDLTDLLRMAGTGQQAGEPEISAGIDTLRLYLGLRPVHYPLTAGSIECRTYLGALWETWAQPPMDTDVSTLVVRLLLAVFGPSLSNREAEPDPLSEAAVTLLVEVVTDQRVPLNADTVAVIARVLSAFPALYEDPRLSRDWWARVEQLRPAIRDPAERLRAALRGSQSDTDAVEIAMLAGKAAARGLDPEELSEIIRRWLADQPPPHRDAVLGIIGGTRRLLSPAGDRSHDRYLATLAARLGLTEERAVSFPWRRLGRS
jgi:hypothetical protein